MVDVKYAINPAIRPPGNEGIEHFFLKQVAVSILRHRYSCEYACTEVHVGRPSQGMKKEYLDRNLGDAERADAVGISLKDNTIRVVEVKTSQSDLSSGYAFGGDYNYIMCPAGRINLSSVPTVIGVMEADLDEVGWYRKRSRKEITGVEVVRNPQRVKIENKDYMLEHVMDSMLRKHSNRQVYKNLWFYES